jgi:hypothetical protein
MRTGKKAKHMPRQRDRLDHILPQGYLAGFTSPTHAGNLHVYDCKGQRWFESGTARVSASRGFYDLLPGSPEELNAEKAFADLERNFPGVRDGLLSTGFSAWEKQIDFLLTFAQMLRARSRLFRHQKLADGLMRPMGRVVEVTQVPSTTRPGEFDSQIRYESITDVKERTTFAKQRAILDMRDEITKGPDWMRGLHWCVRMAPDVKNPVITGDDAIVTMGKSTPQGGFHDPSFRVLIPLSWQACLVGAHARSANSIAILHPNEVRQIHAFYLRGGGHFAYSPIPLAR